MASNYPLAEIGSSTCSYKFAPSSILNKTVPCVKDVCTFNLGIAGTYKIPCNPTTTRLSKFAGCLKDCPGVTGF
jgi:hypothetical protein